MLSYGSIAFASEFATGVARSAVDAMDDAFADLPDSVGPPLHRRPRAVHGRAGLVSAADRPAIYWKTT